MARPSINDFVFKMARKRFLELVREFAVSVGVASRFVEHLSPEDLSNPDTFSDILANYRIQPDSRVACFLLASKAVHSEIDHHFKSKGSENTKALIREMPTARHMRLKLQVEYTLASVKETNEGISKLRAAGRMRDEQLLQAIEHEVNQIRHEMKLPKDDLGVRADQSQDINKSAASSADLQSAKDSVTSDQPYEEEISSEVNEHTNTNVSIGEIDELTSKLTHQHRAIEELRKDQAGLRERLNTLENHVEVITERATSSSTSVSGIVESFPRLREELATSIQAHLHLAKSETDGHREELNREFAALKSSMDSFWSGDGWLDKVNLLLQEQHQSMTVSIDNLKAELALKDGIDPEARSQIEKLVNDIEGSMKTVDSLKEQFSQLHQDLAKLIETLVHESLSANSERLACIVVKEMNRVQQFLEDLNEPDVKKLILDLKNDQRFTREFIELIKLIAPKA